MRRVTISNNLQKARDNSRNYEFMLFDDDRQNIVTEKDDITIKVGNRTGLLFDAKPEVENGMITLSAEAFENLPADEYRLEFWMYRNDRLYIYPDDKQITLRLSSTLNDVAGEVVNTIAIEQLRKEIAEAGGTSVAGPKGDKGDPGSAGRDGVDGSQGPKGDQGKKGADGKSAYQIWLDLGNTGSEQDFIESLKPKSETATRHTPTGWALDRTTTPWTVWFDNGCGLQFPEYATTSTVYGYGFSENLTSTDFASWPLIPNVIRAARGAITVDKFKSKSGEFDY